MRCLEAPAEELACRVQCRKLSRPTSIPLDEVVALRHLVAELDPDRRDAFVATQVLGLSYAEAAQICDCPVGTIRSRVARAREELLAALRETSDRHLGRAAR